MKIEISSNIHGFGHTNKKKGISIALGNVQSIKSKSLHISRLLNDETDICALTETWLHDHGHDKAWVNSSDLNKNGYKVDTINKWKNRVGGVALVWNDRITCKKLKSEIKSAIDMECGNLYVKT